MQAIKINYDETLRPKALAKYIHCVIQEQIFLELIYNRISIYLNLPIAHKIRSS